MSREEVDRSIAELDQDILFSDTIQGRVLDALLLPFCDDLECCPRYDTRFQRVRSHTHRRAEVSYNVQGNWLSFSRGPYSPAPSPNGCLIPGYHGDSLGLVLPVVSAKTFVHVGTGTATLPCLFTPDMKSVCKTPTTRTRKPGRTPMPQQTI